MAILVPTCCQEVPNLTPRSPKRAQLVAKIAQNTPQEPPTRSPKMWSKRCSVIRFYISAIFLEIAPKTAKNGQKSAPHGLKMAILASTWKLLAPSWLQVGAILPHSAEILVDPSPAKITQNQSRQLLVDFSSQGRPQELPDPLQTSIFQDLGTIFDTFLIDFSKRIFIDSALKLQLFECIF